MATEAKTAAAAPAPERMVETPELYQDAWLAMREAAARLAEFEEADAENVHLAPQIARACRHHLYLIRPFFEKLNGRETHTLEDALGRTEAILMGVHAIARFHERDPDPWEAWTAIGFLSRLFDEHTAEGAAERWAARDREFNKSCDEIGSSAA